MKEQKEKGGQTLLRKGVSEIWSVSTKDSNRRLTGRGRAIQTDLKEKKIARHKDEEDMFVSTKGAEILVRRVKKQ